MDLASTGLVGRRSAGRIADCEGTLRADVDETARARSAMRANMTCGVSASGVDERRREWRKCV